MLRISHVHRNLLRTSFDALLWWVLSAYRSVNQWWLYIKGTDGLWCVYIDSCDKTETAHGWGRYAIVVVQTMWSTLKRKLRCAWDAMKDFKGTPSCFRTGGTTGRFVRGGTLSSPGIAGKWVTESSSELYVQKVMSYLNTIVPSQWPFPPRRTRLTICNRCRRPCRWVDVIFCVECRMGPLCVQCLTVHPCRP